MTRGSVTKDGPVRRLLITGGAGFIGSNFVHYWRGRYPNDVIVVLDKLTYAGRRANIENVPDVTFVEGDICDGALVKELLAQNRLDTIVHFAAESHVDRSVAEPDAFITANVLGTQRLLEQARSLWLNEGEQPQHHFHHVSTDEVYGSIDANAEPVAEDYRYAPNSPYSASKAASDHLVRAYNRSFGLRTTISNCANNYGPYQYAEKLVPSFLLRCLAGQKLPIYGDGQNRREWLHVNDHCGGIDRILQHGRSGEQYNLGAGTDLTNIAMTELLCAAVDAAFTRDPVLAERFPDAPPANGGDSRSLMVFVQDRPGHDFRYALDSTKAERDLAFQPNCDLKQGLDQTVRWYLDNENFWRNSSSDVVTRSGEASPAHSASPVTE